MNDPALTPNRGDENRDLDDTVVVLSGGVGGAKLAVGLSKVVDGAKLMVVGNTGDDFEHLGLCISPDLDTLMYTLVGLNNEELGWGQRDETWAFMDALAALGGETWFKLGDRDLATHIERTRRIAAGESLSAVTSAFCKTLGVRQKLLPMSDDRVRTRIRTDEGWLDFQEYFVRRQCQPTVRELTYEGIASAKAHRKVLEALRHPRLRCVVVSPSNPMISIEPILALAEVREALVACGAPVIAVSPIIAGAAVKGPTAKMMMEMAIVPSAAAIALRYADILDTLIVDEVDSKTHAPDGMRVIAANTLMTTMDQKVALAKIVLRVAEASNAKAVA